MRFGWHGKTDGINGSNQGLPICDRLNVVLLSDFVRARVVDVETLTNCERPSSESVCVNAPHAAFPGVRRR